MNHSRARSASCRRSFDIDPTYLKLQIALKECEELKETVTFIEYYLAKSKSDSKNLTISLQSSEAFSKELKDKLKSQIILNTNLNRENSALHSEIEKLKSQIILEKESLSSNSNKWESEKEILNEKIRSLKESNTMAKEEIDMYRRTKILNKTKLITLMEKVTGDWTIVPAAEVEDTERHCNSSIEFCSQIPKLKQELSRLANDNNKLAKIIQKSPGLEYFSEMQIDSGNVTYNNEKVRCKRKNCGANSGAFLGDDWIPLPVYNAIRDFNSAYDDPVLNAALNQLIVKLNLIWQKRETLKVEREKEKATKFIKNMKSKTISLSNTPSSLRKTLKPANKKCIYCQNNEIYPEKPEIARKIKERYEDVSKALEVMIKEYFDIKDRSPTSARRDEECLIVSILGVLGEFTDNLISIL